MEPWISNIIESIIKLLIVVSIGCFAGCIFEYRGWMSTASFLAKPLIRLGRLPELCGTSFLTAFVSNKAANSMIAGAYDEGKLTKRELILSGIANSFPTMVSHAIRSMFVVIFILGLPAILYFTIQFGIELLRTVIILYLFKSKESKADIEDPEIMKKKAHTWDETLKKSYSRTLDLLVRVLLITVPIYILVAYLVHIGVFKDMQKAMPAFFRHYFTSEMMAVMLARLGRFYTAAQTAGEFFNMKMISTSQILIAFFAGNLITNPIRTLRRNLPSAVGIFPGRTGIWIVLILQSCRFVSALVVVIILFALVKLGL